MLVWLVLLGMAKEKCELSSVTSEMKLSLVKEVLVQSACDIPYGKL